MTYSVMVCEGKYPILPIARGPELGEVWYSGRSIAQPAILPLLYVLDSELSGNPKVMYDEQAIPVMHADVVAALVAAGVDNIQYFDALLRDPINGREYTDYKSYNIIGLVACADMAASELMGTSDSDMLDVDFHALTIDESKTHGLLLFRLAECVSATIVHENVKQAIQRAGLPGFIFYGPGEWSG